MTDQQDSGQPTIIARGGSPQRATEHTSSTPPANPRDEALDHLGHDIGASDTEFRQFFTNLTELV